MMIIVLACAWASGCGPQPILDKDWPDAYWRRGPFVLIAIDTEAQMALDFDSHGSGLITLVGPTVFSVGANERFIVAKQHPCADDEHFERTVTNYYVVDRMTQRRSGERWTIDVDGPFTKNEFDSLAQALPLPSFSKTFHKLEWQGTGE